MNTFAAKRLGARTTSKATYTFRLDYTDEMPGGDRSYEVHRFGRIIGLVSNDWASSATEGGTPVRWWYFESNDGRKGSAKTRQAAVEAAMAKVTS
jgi:hypothetical protein